MNFEFDLKYAWRLLVKSWGYSLMCAAVVALGVGLVVWSYCLAYSQVLKPLGFPGAERWYSVQLAAQATAAPRPSIDPYTYQELLKHNRSADYLGAFAAETAVLSEGQASTRLRAARINARLLAAMQVPPQQGRILQDSDGEPGASAVAVLSYTAWQDYFGGDPAIVGKNVRINASPVQVVGVMPRDFYAFQDFELWLPLETSRSAQGGYAAHLARPSDSSQRLAPIVVLKPDQSAETLLGEMQAAVERVNHDYPDFFHATRRAALIPAHRMSTHDLLPIVVMLCLMAGAILLLACVNISMVFLARLLERSRELALRTALGASRERLVRQCLLETALIVVVGLVAGYGLAALGVRWAQSLSDFTTRVLANGRQPNDLVLRPVDLLTALACAVVIWLLSTLVPAWRVIKQDAAVVLAGSGKGASVRTSNRSVGLLVGLQVVVSSVVLVVCANVVLAVRKELTKGTGLNTNRVMVTTEPVPLDDGRYTQPGERLRYWDELKAAIASRLPGAETALTTAAPTRPTTTAAAVEAQQGTATQGSLKLPVTVVSEGYFDLLGLKLRAGRTFDATDNAESLPVAVVDEGLARRHWPHEEVLGKRVQLSPTENGPWLTIVGVVSTVSAGPYRRQAGVLYRSWRQAAPTAFRLLVRPPGGDGDSRQALRQAAFAVDRDVLLHNLQSLDDYLTALDLDYKAIGPLVSVIALITALLASSGLFGLISRSVAQRTQEVGIRRALGASPWRATSMFMRQGAIYLATAIVGVGLGIAIMPLLSAAIDNILERVVLATLAVVLLMAAVIFAASYLPSRRSVALEPGDALRYE